MGALKKRIDARGMATLFDGARPFSPCPNRQDRAPWNRVPDLERKRILAQAEGFRNREWPVLPATRYLDYARTGDRDRFQRLYMERRVALAHLAVAECLENTGRFLDPIGDLVWAVCEESSWCLPAHQSWHGNPNGLPDTRDPVIDLFAAETAAILAMVAHLVGDGMDGFSPHAVRRIRHEIRSRIFEPFFKVDHYHWMALKNDFINNHTPWTCSNVLLAFLLVEQDLPTLHRALEKMITGLDRYFESIPEDGGCDEGPRYWTLSAGSFFECLELLHMASQGRFDLFGESKLRNMGAFLHRVHIDSDWYVNFADGNARVAIPTGLCHRFGQATGDADLMELASASQAAMGRETPPSENNYKLYRLARHALHLSEMQGPATGFPARPESWLPKIQVLTAREKGDTRQGLFLGAKGGHNGESHNHNDVGHFVVFSDGRPAIVDIGVEVYTAATFGPGRYELATMRSSFHNLLPTVNGLEQNEGRDFKAKDVWFEQSGRRISMSLELSPAWPAETGLTSFQRQIAMERGEAARITLSDRLTFRKKPKSLDMGLMTAQTPTVLSDDHLLIPVEGVRGLCLSWTADLFESVIEPLELTDETLRAIWGPRLWRTRFIAKNPANTMEWTFTLARAPSGK